MLNFGMLNPFLGSVVSDPWKSTQVDVPEIHAAAFQECRQAISYVQKRQQSTSIIIHGEAGSGKTHLMARLRTYLSEMPAVFVSVPLQTSPLTLWRHVRRCLVDDLLRPANNDLSQLKKIIGRQLKDRSQPFEAWLSHVQMDHDLYGVLNHLLQDEYRRETRAWLRGDSLNEMDLSNLGLPVTSEDEEAPEDKARRVTLSLCKLFGSDIVLIFCFDQVEALQNRPEEKMGLSAFGRMIQGLHDGTSNALLISCMQSNYVDPLFDAVEPANKERLASYGRRALLSLTFDQALSLIAARLDGLSELAKQRQTRPRLWPLTERDIKHFFSSRPVQTFTAREVIAHCAQLFETAKGKPQEAVDRPADFLEKEWQLRLEERAVGSNPDDSDQILQHGLPVLMSLGDEFRIKEHDSLNDIDLTFSSKEGRRIEISLCNQPNMTSLAFQLKRLSEGLKKGRYQNLILIRDPRRGIKPTAKKTLEYLSELKKRGARMIHPPVEVLAALDALRSLLAEAKAGDLAFQGQTLGPETLKKWSEENMPSALQDFMGDLSASTPEKDDFPVEALLALLEEKSLLPLSEAATQMAQPALALEAWVRRNPGLVGLLNGPPSVLFQIVSDTVSNTSFSENYSEPVFPRFFGESIRGVPLTVSQVRDALYVRTAAEKTGSPYSSTPLLGSLFHQIFQDLVGPDLRLNWLGVLIDADPDEGEWKRLLRKHSYCRLVGPRLIKEQSRLQQTTEEVLNFWQGVQSLTDWVAGLLWTARKKGFLPQVIDSTTSWPDRLFRTEVPLVWDVSQDGWEDSVHLTGVADLIVRGPDECGCAVVEIKLGRGSEMADLSQACLYFMMFSGRESGFSGNPDLIDIIHFQPEPKELLVNADQIGKVKQELLDLIGRLAGVIPAEDKATKKIAIPSKSSEIPLKQKQMGNKVIEVFREYGLTLELASEPVLGPTFFRFLLLLGEGVRLGPVQRLAQEIQMRLSLETTPMIHLDQGQVVIDLQRPDRRTVLFSEIIDQLPQADQGSGCSKVLLGVDLQGQLQFADLTKPEHTHLLAAGTTGSGKSEWLLSALAGLLKTNTPETLRLILIDPKRVVFSDLRESPFLFDEHSLVYPDETSPLVVLNNLVEEMERRYLLLGTGESSVLSSSPSMRFPRIVCFCDEYYDLIQRGRKEREALEALIFRLGAKARAAGIHLILATQQPSRQVIKGALDANIPARLGFKTNKAIESKMLLNTSGAENLLGAGDFLFKDIGDPIRLQAPLLTPELRMEIFTMGNK